DGLSAPIHNMANIPVESIEAEHPIRVERYELVPDTEGAGKFRGGLAIRRHYRVLADDTMFQLRSDRTEFAPWGLDGGHDGVKTESHLDSNGTSRKLPGKCLIKLQENDLYRLLQASGGGYGSPLERDP